MEKNIMEMKFTQGNQSMTLKTDGESLQDAVELAQKVIGWGFEQIIELKVVEEEDDAIYIETNQPKDHVLHDGM
tara:strand:+ start:4420 stop:4641 length:222 start_codon:yes stop_codon:yes gene_type:complete